MTTFQSQNATKIKSHETSTNSIGTNDQISRFEISDKDWFQKRWSDRIKDYSSLHNLLDSIEGDSDDLEAAVNFTNNIDDWFNAYLCSNDFSQLDAGVKMQAIKAKDAVKFLLENSISFLSGNNLGGYESHSTAPHSNNASQSNKLPQWMSLARVLNGGSGVNSENKTQNTSAILGSLNNWAFKPIESK